MNHCGEKNPIDWLKENWRNMIDTVVTLATNYGHERKENNIGTISVSEARDALRLHKGNVWTAVTECVEQRQKKVMLSNYQISAFMNKRRFLSFPQKVLYLNSSVKQPFII